MGKALSIDQVLRLRLRSQQLVGERAGEVAETVGRVGALQAQSTRAARLAVRPRAQRVDAEAVDRACNQTRTVVRTWAMRGTLQMLAARDIGWVIELFRPPPDRVSSRQQQLGLDAALLRRALPAIQEILAGGAQLTRAALVEQLAAHGVVVAPRSQAPAHLIGYAARQGLICRGPDRSDDEPTYVLLDEWVGQPARLEPDQALAELARRYVHAHGPAGPDDFGYWSGLAVGTARRAFTLIADELRAVEAAGEQAWLAADAALAALPASQPCVRLLPHFDAYLLGYRSRQAFLPARYAHRIQAGGGFIQPAVLVDGRVVGTWRQQRASTRTVVTIEPFEQLDPAVRRGLAAEAADLGRFQGQPAALAIED